MTNTNEIRSAGFIYYVESLCWEAYGHWRADPPQWAAQYAKTAKELAKIAKPSEMKWSISGGHYEDNNYHCEYSIFDAANPWLEPWTVGLQTKNEQTAKSYVQGRFNEMAHLTAGELEALIYYRETGKPIMPRWIPDSQLKIKDKSGKLIGEYPRLS